MVRAYKLSDPPTRRQEPISPRALRRLLRGASSKRDKFIANLIVGAFFYACRSCEYVLTSGDPRSRIIRAQDVRFFYIKSGQAITVPAGSARATGVQIHFRMQKNLSAEDRISMHATGDELCPVKAWTHVVTEIGRTKRGTTGVSVNQFDGKGGDIRYIDIDRAVKGVMRKMQGKDSGLAYGTHSIRCGAALAMYLNGTSVVDIMLQGRWCSDAFLLYIKREVLQRSVGISADMLKTDDYAILPRRPEKASLHRSRSALTMRSSREGDHYASPALHLSH